MTVCMHERTSDHLISVQDFDAERIDDLFQRAEHLRRHPEDARRYQGRIVGLLFYEPSTRTRLSFESASLRIGAQCLGFGDPRTASVMKGETLLDTIRTVQRYCDVIVLRHQADGAARLASLVAMIPIVNGGDGSREHPTQTLCDLYTIWQRFGDIGGRTIGLVGDLRYGRTVHSLSLAAASLGAALVCIAPEELQMPAHLLRRLRTMTTVNLESRMSRAIGDLDVLYVTRLQRERMDGINPSDVDGYPLTPTHLAHARPDLMVLHPLPRAGEIAYEVDRDPRAWYFEQVANGVLIRMTLLDQLFGQSSPMPLGALAAPPVCHDPPWEHQDGRPAPPCLNSQCVTRHERAIMPRYEPLANAPGSVRCVYCDFERALEAG